MKKCLYLCVLAYACLSLIQGGLYADVISENESLDIQEPAGTYDVDEPVLLNMTAQTVISNGPCVTGDYSGCTFSDVLNDIDAHDDFKPEIRVHFSADDYLDDGLESNAEMRQRGNASREAPQKSFRIKLDKGLPLWRGERKIQLIKSAFDPSRIRNKLSFDLMADIPHLPSMRTQFVHLNMIDQGVSQDYGLYTQIEYFGKEYLERRGWDKDSRIYKVENSGLYNDSALALDANGKPLDLAAFEELFEIKRGDSHFDLANMIRDLNDPSVDFNTQVMGKYFNQDNYLTWFAVNLLLNNQDTHFHNYYLYNPKDKDDFYLIPWDYDSALGMVPDEPEITEARLPRWWLSHANYWEITLHQRFLSQPGNLQLLADAVTEIKNKYLTPEKIAAKRDAYYDIAFPVIRNTQDWDYLYIGDTNPEQVAAYDQIFAKLSRQVDIQYDRFMTRLYDPMTFKMNAPEISDNFSQDSNILFSWRESRSLIGQTIRYDLDIATDREFVEGTVVEHISGISGLSHLLHWTHPKGDYYFRVIARDADAPQQHWQVALNGSLTYNNSWVELHGVEYVYIPEDGDLNAPQAPTEPPVQEPEPEPDPPQQTEDEQSPSTVSSQSGGGGISNGLLLMLSLIALAQSRKYKANIRA